MLQSILASHVSNVARQKSIYLIFAFVMLLLNVSLVTAMLIREDKVIIVPPEINKTFWVTKSSTSREYIEEMSVFLAYLMLDQTPSSVAHKREMILKYVSSEYYNALFQKLTHQEEYISANDISTKFSLQEIKVKENASTITGELSHYVADKMIEKAQVTYKLTFEYSGYRLLLSSFKKEGDA